MTMKNKSFRANDFDYYPVCGKITVYIEPLWAVYVYGKYVFLNLN